MKTLYFLKLGGSLITEKDRAHTPRPLVLSRLAAEILTALEQKPDRQILLGHGSGSFGHVPAKEFATRQGVRTEAQWRGFIDVWRQAGELNELVIHAMHQVGLPAITFSPSAALFTEGGQVISWNLQPVEAALKAGLLPVIHGDVAFDNQLGGTILSTEDLFNDLADHLKPSRILLAGIERGVWLDYPRCTRLAHEITPNNYQEISASLQGSSSPDVTGGMLTKVESSLALISRLPGLEVSIFSGEEPGNVQRALNSETLGTIIRGSTL
jgi:isopentenyl phosphate kinase